MNGAQSHRKSACGVGCVTGAAGSRDRFSLDRCFLRSGRTVPRRYRAFGLLLWSWIVSGILWSGCPKQQVRPPHCGNGVVEGREECDDGNSVGGDGCSAYCTKEGGEICGNYEDDDHDGLADCADPDCQGNPVCFEPLENCHNAADDDGDGLIDCADPDCAETSFCLPDEDCTNGIDDDHDGLTDCQEPDCAGLPVCGACDATLDLGLVGPGDATTIALDRNSALASSVLDCGPPGSFEMQVRLEVQVSVHLSVSGHLAAQEALGLEQEVAPGESCTLLAWGCGQAGSDGLLDLLWYRLPPGTYRLAYRPTQDASAQEPAPVLSLDLRDGSHEISCADGLDEDGDGLTDCEDDDCTSDAACLVELCDNGIDDDQDGSTDCEDDDCAQDPACLPPEDCSNGMDDDNDGLVDCADLDCAGNAACQGGLCVVNRDLGNLGRGDRVLWSFDTRGASDLAVLSCGGGREVVADFRLESRSVVLVHVEQTGHHVLALTTESGPDRWCNEAEIDCVDPGGAGQDIDIAYRLPPARYFLFVEAISEDATGTGTVTVRVADDLSEICDDGIDDNGDGLTDCNDPECMTSQACLPESACHDGIDDDGDGWTDCADSDCVATAPCIGSACLADRNLGLLPQDRPLYVTDSTEGLTDRFQASCNPWPGPDRVYTFDLDAPSSVILRLSQGLDSDHGLALAFPGGPGSSCIQWEHLCAASAGPGLPVVVRTDPLPAGRYEVLVDAYGEQGSGPFTLQVSRGSQP